MITQLAVTLYPNDCMSSLCLMLLLNDETYSEKVIKSFPPTDTVEKFALYYYSLKFALTADDEMKDVTGTESPSAVGISIMKLFGFRMRHDRVFSIKGNFFFFFL